VLQSLLAAVALALLVVAPVTHHHSAFNLSERCATCAVTLHTPSAINSLAAPLPPPTIATVLSVSEPVGLSIPLRAAHGSRSPPL
jgi:hypothetical protein